MNFYDPWLRPLSVPFCMKQPCSNENNIIIPLVAVRQLITLMHG